MVGERSVCDHFLIWLKGMVKYLGLKPFKLFKCWFNHEGFQSFVEELGKSFDNIRGKPGFVLKEKMSKLKVLIRKWNKEVFGVVDLEIYIAINFLNNLDSMVATVEGESIWALLRPGLLLLNLSGMVFLKGKVL